MERFELLLAEYDDLRRDIGRRTVAQLLILGLNPILVVAMLAIYGAQDNQPAVALVAAPSLFTVLAWLHVIQDLSIINISTYLQQRLRPAIVAGLPTPDVTDSADDDAVLAWETHLGRGRRAETGGPVQTYLWAMRYLAVLGPAVGFTVWGLAKLDRAAAGRLEEVAVIGVAVVNVVLLAGVVVLTRSVAPGYRAVTAPDRTPRR